MQTPLNEIGPRFVTMAHGIGLAVAATVDRRGRPRTRVVQPVWEWDGAALTGWVSTVTTSPKVADLARTPVLSLTYWHPEQDTCTAVCDVVPVDELDGPDGRAAAWRRFAEAPPPAGFDPGHWPDWDSPAAPTFGVYRLTPTRLTVTDGTLVTAGNGDHLTWHRSGG